MRWSRRLRLRGRQGLRDAAAAGAARRRPAGARAGRARGAQGAARRRARERRSRASSRAPGLPRSTRRRSRRDPKKGEFYVAVIEQPGPPDAGGHRPRSCRRSSRLPVAEIDALGRRPRQSPGRCAGCARCTRSSAPSGRRPRSPRSCASRSTASLRRRHPRPSLHGAGADPGAPLRRLRRQARAGQGRARRRPAQGDHPRRRQRPRLRAGLELVEDEGLLEEVAGLVEWPVVLMGASTRRSSTIPPEVIRATIRANQKCFVLRDPRTATLANRFVLVANIEARRRRQGDRRRQRARRPRAALRCEVLLGDRPEDRGSKTGCEKLERASSSTRSSARRASASSASRRWPASWRRSSAPIRTRPSARRCSPRPTSSPRWSASSPSCRA